MFQYLDTLDSRALRATDCYGQRFMRVGNYRWAALPSGSSAVDLERPYLIKVNERKSDGKMAQHTLQLRWDGRRFSSNKAELAIEAGDLVVWNCPEQDAPPYEVAGDKTFFHSAALTNECGYSHAFGLPGQYEWADAYGSGLAGTIVVKPVECKARADLAHWQATLSKATLVMVQSGKAEPSRVEIQVGQTVYFAIVTSNGISITDKRLHKLGHCGDPCKTGKS